jgi:hypothetical protein
MNPGLKLDKGRKLMLGYHHTLVLRPSSFINSALGTSAGLFQINHRTLSEGWGFSKGFALA